MGAAFLEISKSSPQQVADTYALAIGSQTCRQPDATNSGLRTIPQLYAMTTFNLTPDIFMIQHPDSPPMTPGARRLQTRSAPATRQSSPFSKRMASSQLLHTPPLEYIEPIGDSHRFNFTRPQSLDLSSGPSSISGRAYATTTLQESEDEYESTEEAEEEIPRPVRLTKYAQFILEELDYDPGYYGDVEILQPYHCEDAKSEKSLKSCSGMDKNEVYERMTELRLEQETSDEEERDERQWRRYRQKKKRWSKGLYKRTHSQSVEGDSDYSDNDPLDDNDPTARRLRRRVRGPGDRERRGSLMFHDLGYANTNNIIEVEEPDECGVVHSRGPPSIPSDDAFTLDELPFFSRLGETMDLEYEESDY